MPLLKSKKDRIASASESPNILDEVIRGAGMKSLEMLQGSQKDPLVASGPMDNGQPTFVASSGGEAMPGYGAKLSDVNQGFKKQGVSLNKGSKLNSVVSAGQELGRGLIEGALGMPNKGKSNIPFYAGRLPGDVLRTRLSLQTAGEATQQNITNQGTPLASSSVGPETFQLLQGELAAIPQETLANPAKYMPEYRKLIMKYPGAQSFLDSYFGLKRNYDYNVSNSLPTGKYNLPGAE